MKWYDDTNIAMRNLSTSDCDIAILDTSMPGMQTHKFITKAKKLSPNTQVMIHTTIDIEEDVVASIKAGATSYMLQNSTCVELAKALIDLNSGGAPMSPKVARYLIDQLQAESLAKSLNVLTDREKEVFQCIEEGKTYKGIGCQLSISRNTVHTHIKNIYGKLQAGNKQDALLKARKLLAA